MIVVHFFTRRIRRKTYLMADSSASEGAEPLWSTADVVCEVGEADAPESWIPRAKARILDAHPELEHLRTLTAVRRPGAAQAFDMVFNVRDGGTPPPHRRESK